MGRKDLSRTVIEGGRYFHNSWQRRASHGIERARTRAWLAAVASDPDEAEDTDAVPKPRVRKSFRDKLGPAYRWIDAQVGRAWNTVRAELFARFDSRTIAGHHVLFDHVLREIAAEGIELPRNLKRGDRWYVDDHGVLRRALIGGKTWRQIYRETLAWRGTRRAAVTEQGWWWYQRAPVGPRCGDYRCTLVHYDDRTHRLAFVPTAPLTRGDHRRIDRLPDDIRREVVVPASVVNASRVR